METKADFHKANAVLSSLGIEQLACLEVQFVHKFRKCAHDGCVIALDWLKTAADTVGEQRKLRKMDTTRIDAVVQARGSLHELETFLGALPEAEKPKMFLKPSDDPTTSWRVGEFDISQISQFTAATHEAINNWLETWRAHLADLSTLVESYVPTGWEACKDTILREESAEMLQKLIRNPKLSAMGKSSTLLSSWKKLYKQACCVEGLAPLAYVEHFVTWTRVEKDAMECFRFSMDCQMVCQELPSIRNNNKRMGKAKQFKAERHHAQIGKDLAGRLDRLIDGSWPEKDANDDGTAPVDASE